MFDEKNHDRNDALGQRLQRIGGQMNPSPQLKKAAKTGVPLRAAGRNYTAGTHVRKFTKAVLTYAACIALFLGAILLIPKWWGGNEPVASGQCNHKYVALTIGLPSSCTEGRIHAYQCQYCGHTYSERDPAPGHYFVSGVCTRCGEAEPADCKPMPDDFAFSITFNVYGISSYDSETGRLVKTNDPANSDLEKYATTLILSDEQMEEIYRLLSDLDLASYPTSYRPTDASSKPPAYWELTVQIAGDSHQVCCSFLPAGPFEGRDEKAQAFIDTFERICEIITSTEEWKSLPDPEVLYA